MGKKVIIYTQAYNAEKTIRRAIDSILNQTFTEFAYYICDNASTDKTWDIMQDYAKIDNRIHLLRNEKNTFSTKIDGWSTITFTEYMAKNLSVDFYCTLDADDEYKLDFIEKVIAFMVEYNLDITACGYEKIDATNGKVLKSRHLDYNLVISDSDFSEKFIEYRGFMPFFWSKMFSIDLIKKARYFEDPLPRSACLDSIYSLLHFQSALRVGVYGEAMCKYYQYPDSTSKTFKRDTYKGYDLYWEYIKNFIHIKSNGNISKLNEDFLYAIYLSMIEDMLNLIFADSSINLSQKSIYIRDVLNNKLAGLTFTREADPIFQNLSNRKEFLINIINRINSCFSGDDANVGKTLELINKIKSGIPK